MTNVAHQFNEKYLIKNNFSFYLSEISLKFRLFSSFLEAHNNKKKILLREIVNCIFFTKGVLSILFNFFTLPCFSSSIFFFFLLLYPKLYRTVQHTMSRCTWAKNLSLYTFYNFLSLQIFFHETAGNILLLFNVFIIKKIMVFWNVC